jgi:hypothetical protein
MMMMMMMVVVVVVMMMMMMKKKMLMLMMLMLLTMLRHDRSLGGGLACGQAWAGGCSHLRRKLRPIGGRYDINAAVNYSLGGHKSLNAAYRERGHR